MKPSKLQGRRKKTRKRRRMRMTKIAMERMKSLMNWCFKKALVAMMRILKWLKKSMKKGETLTLSLRLTVWSIGHVIEAIG